MRIEVYVLARRWMKERGRREVYIRRFENGMKIPEYQNGMKRPCYSWIYCSLYV